MHILRHIAAGAAAVGLILAATSCRNSAVSNPSGLDHEALTNEIDSLLAGVPAQVGVAVILDGTDTVTVNNSADYPMKSMFKLQEAYPYAALWVNAGRQSTRCSTYRAPRSTPTPGAPC